jgi:hypothetical protein
MKSAAFVAGIELVEEAIEADQSFVGILRSEIDAVVVIPERTQRFVDIACWSVIRIESRQYVGIILIAEVSGTVEVARIAVALGRGVTVVQVGRDE